MRLAGLAFLLLAVATTAPPALAQSRTIEPQPAREPSGAGFYGDSWAVIVGINNYRHPRVPKLRYAVNDARALEEALLAQGFRRDRIITLIDAEATKVAIEVALGDDLRRKAGPNDRVLVFFAGHGKTDRLRSGEEEGYLVPVDGDPGRLFGTAISMTALRQISDRLLAKHVLYVVDACYSGYALFNRAIADDLIEEMVRKPAIQILTAGRQQDQAQERGGHGVFTDVLLRGLRGEAFGGRGWLALDQLGAWVRERVYAESNRKQVPQYGNLAGDGQFVFLRPAGVPAGVTPSVRSDGLEAERRRLEAERRRLEQERALLEEQRRVEAERQRVEEERRRLEAERRQLEESRRRPEPPVVAAVPPGDAGLRERLAGTTWKQTCRRGDGGPCDPHTSYVLLQANGTFVYNYQAPRDFTANAANTWTVKDGYLLLSWNSGYAVDRLRLERADATLLTGTQSNLAGSMLRMERVGP